jgi:hypothetical protein
MTEGKAGPPARASLPARQNVSPVPGRWDNSMPPDEAAYDVEC